MVFSGKNKVFLSVETLRQNTNVFIKLGLDTYITYI